MLKKFKLSTKILAVGLAITLCFTLLLIGMYPKYKNNMYETKRVKTRQLVESAWGVVDRYVQLAKEGAMTVEEARARAKTTVANMRYDDNDYFWINDMGPTMIMHPIKPKLDGKALGSFKDPNGKRLFVAMVDVCKSKGGGFVDYYWPKPGDPEPVPKISYVKAHPAWGWIVGSGIYIDDVEAEIATVTWTVGGIAGAIILGGIFLAFFMARSIARPIDRIIEGMSEGSEQVAAASNQVSSSSQQLAEGASEQAASLEETSSSLEEMASMTRQNADNANQADRLMKEANQVVSQANESMGELTTSMQDISEASEETQKIIKTIDEIAFQTNLLALNAAVEAARAGEAGAGFAVVADEVRNLAMRAADAAKNTAELIEGTVKKIHDGSELVDKTNGAFSEVATSAAKVGELVGEIAAASNEQAQGIDQVNKAVHEMDKVTQQTAANAEESASASEEMNAQAEQMKGYVGDLVVLVGGVSNGKGNGLAGQQARLARAAHSGAPRLQTQKEKQNGPSTAPGSKVSPEEVIPMEDEEEFKDF